MRGFVVLCLLVLALSQTPPRPPHVRPPPDQLNYNCKADTNIPRFVPTLDPNTKRNIYSPQSDTTYYVVARWIAAFKKFYPNIIINATVIGSGIAGPCLAKSQCEMSIIGREMLFSEKKLFTDAWKYAPFEFPVTGGSFAALAYTDAMTVMVHPSNPLSEVTFAEFDAIYSSTRYRGLLDITKWGQLGLEGDWTEKPIHLVGVEIPNGFEEFLNRTILLGGEWKKDIETRSTVFDLATIVSENPAAIGYTGLAFLNATVKLLNLSENGGWPYDGKLNYVYPNSTDVCSREYPLSRLIYLYANKVPELPLDPVIREFLRFILSYEGQKAVEDDHIFLPLPLTVVRQLRKQLV